MNTQQEHKNIPGYDYGTDKVAKSPITLDEWETLKKSALVFRRGCRLPAPVP